jgi:FKBP-type peptidyl-prolyl cis-trans isomerase
MRKMFLIAVAVAFYAVSAVAKPVYENEDTSNATDTDEVSYAFGVVFGFQFRDTGLSFNYDEVIKGFQDAFEGKSKMTDDEAIDVAQAAYSEVLEKKAEENKVKEEAFLTENSLKDTVIVSETGLQYEILEEGDGPKPSADDIVVVNYEGRLMDGTIFDSSYARGESAEFSLDMVVDGWSEGLQLMNVGSKYRLIMPSKLAYGESGAGSTIPPYSPLIFEVELLDILEYSFEDEEIFIEDEEVFEEDPDYSLEDEEVFEEDPDYSLEDEEVFEEDPDDSLEDEEVSEEDPDDDKE